MSERRAKAERRRAKTVNGIAATAALAPLTEAEAEEMGERIQASGQAVTQRVGDVLKTCGLLTPAGTVAIHWGRGIIYQPRIAFLQDIPSRLLYDALGDPTTPEQAIAQTVLDEEARALAAKLPDELRQIANKVEAVLREATEPSRLVIARS